MKSILIVFITLCVGIGSFAQSKKELQTQVNTQQTEINSLKAEINQLKKSKETDISNEAKKASYSLGVLMSSTLKRQGADSLVLDALIAGITDVFKGNPLKVQEQECSAVVQTYMQQAMEKKAAKMKEGGVKFLEENKTKEGVKTTASGLQYKVVTSGKGKMPAAESSVTVHYTGKLIDGTVFDSSVERGSPATFGVSQVIAGWTEAMQLMHEGDKWILYIPAELAYGERGAGGQIPPYSALIFEVELIKVD
jgi:FKBP-type peptidyl-prolyl cis-trans isomerase